jgi:hypothetical protein
VSSPPSSASQDEGARCCDACTYTTAMPLPAVAHTRTAVYSSGDSEIFHAIAKGRRGATHNMHPFYLWDRGDL